MRLPAVRPSLVRPILVANLVGEVVIVITGGIVRLTGSGLGCPTWPECVPGSFTPVPHQEEGIHKLIEFGNRTLTGVVGLLALACVWVVLTRMRRRRPLLLVAVGLVVGVVVQAVVGGIAVRMTLSPVVVAFHFLLSMVMIALSTMLLRGAEDGWSADGTADLGPRDLLAPRLVSLLAGVTAAVAAVVLVLGTIVTGSGPHSGDAEQPARTGFDPRTVAWLHADVVMLFVGLVVAVLVAVWLTSSSDRAKATWRGVLVVTLLQGVIGYVQYFTGLPEVLVGLHMLGASLLVVTVTLGVMNLRRNPL
ncbi:MAG TPA: COX15/CtaA family protein [Lapillicoccus sp.]|nr:COX15/CtaA family protein [Lapillicoccus sp.]